ncbi:MAG: hypothetical protein QF503_03300 [Rhodospirillales bacterium]|nr:hypothetical protein [Rhodospirillales bacterium]
MLPAFEGMVDFEKVKAIAPALSLCESEILDRVRCIREDTSKPLRTDLEEQSREHLEAKFHKLITNFMMETRSLERCEKILVTLARRLGELHSSERGGERQLAAKLCEWLRAEMAID